MATKEPQGYAPTPSQLRLVIDGDPGVGKTTLALSFPRPFILDTEDGIEGDVVQQHPDALGWPIMGYRDAEDAVRWLVARRDDFDTIVLDSLDGLVARLMDEVVAAGAASAGGDLGKEVVPEQKEYLIVQKQVERILTLLRKLGKQIVVTCGVREQEGAKRRPNVTPGVWHVVHRWASIIGELVVVRMNAEGKVDNKGVPTRVLMVDPSSARRECKTRWAALLPHVQDPTFDSIWGRITNKENTK